MRKAGLAVYSGYMNPKHVVFASSVDGKKPPCLELILYKHLKGKYMVVGFGNTRKRTSNANRAQC